MEEVYKIIQPPFTLKFKTMSKSEINDYCKWYLEQIPIRIEILQNAIRNSVDYQGWEANYSPDSLEDLGEWFASQVENREWDEEEKREQFKDAPDWFKNLDIETKVLTNRTFSIAFDVGMYLSQVFLKNNDSLQWKFIKTGSKNYINYGQPVIVNFGGKDFNPVRMIVSLAYGISHHKKSGKSLKLLYDIWLGLI